MDRYKITFDTWNKVANLYEDKFMDLDLYDESYDLFCQQIEVKNPSVLELGCGPGNITRYLLNKRPDLQILATDIAPNMIELAKRNVPQAKFKIMDVREMDQLTEKFDAIIAGFCLPYLSAEDVAYLIRSAKTLLHPGGTLYLSSIEGDYSKSAFQTGSTGHQTFVYYHSLADLTHQLHTNDFKDLQIINVAYPKKEGVLDNHLIVVSKS